MYYVSSLVGGSTDFLSVHFINGIDSLTTLDSFAYV